MASTLSDTPHPGKAHADNIFATWVRKQVVRRWVFGVLLWRTWAELLKVASAIRGRSNWFSMLLGWLQSAADVDVVAVSQEEKAAGQCCSASCLGSVSGYPIDLPLPSRLELACFAPAGVSFSRRLFPGIPSRWSFRLSRSAVGSMSPRSEQKEDFHGLEA